MLVIVHAKHLPQLRKVEGGGCVSQSEQLMEMTSTHGKAPAIPRSIGGRKAGMPPLSEMTMLEIGHNGERY
jgi:hypothetical protein